jgi:hypothetical protein
MSKAHSLAMVVVATLAGGLRAQAPLQVFDGSDYGSLGGYFGTSFAALGDVDRDGYDDLAVGAPYEAVDALPHAGRVRVVSGRDGSVLRTHAGFGFDSHFGGSLAAVGDVDRDGWVDVLVGAPYDDFQGTDSGAAWLYSGRDGTLLFLFVGSGPADLYGWAVAGAGDVDGDSFPDVAVSAYKTADGYVDVLSGREGSLIYRVAPADTDTGFGVAVCGAGDLDLDGLDDIAVGAYRERAVYAFLGPTASSVKKITVPGNAYFGYSLARLGDVTGDGRPELVIGTEPSVSLASVYVWETSTNSFHFVITLTTPSSVSSFGQSVAGPGDLDGDGVPDF